MPSYTGSPDITRPFVKFLPTIWGDRFLATDSEFKAIDATKKQEYDELKEEVRRMLMVANDDEDLLKLDLINAVQRLGVSYHFATEIENSLAKIYHGTTHLHHGDDDDLYACTLRFRLLRQQGYGVSCEWFDKFKNEQGKFKESLIDDVRGMLSLYEASHYSIHGDETLDEALVFTTTHLEKFMVLDSKPHASCLKKQVKHALNRPLRKGMPRLETRHFLTIYQEEDAYNQTLSDFAKWDFNMLQSQYQQELSKITKWWKDSDIPTKLPYTRDRLVEFYFWIIGVYFEPQYSNARWMLQKVGTMISLMDDTYDAYATIDELKLFTDAMDRWDISSMNQLPEYMKVVYGAILDTYEEIDQVIAKEGRSFCSFYAKDALQKLARAYYAEAKWCDEKHIPTVEEYMKVSLISSAYPVIAVSAFVGMSDVAVDEKAFDWVFNNPKIVMASSAVSRLVNDIKSHQFEQERGHAASAVECYMKQYEVSEEEAVAVIMKQVDNAWKDINQEMLKPKNGEMAVPMPILERVLNLTRVLEVVYKEGDGYTNPAIIKDYISSLFLEPIPI